MQITWHGYNCFTIKGKQATIVTDPFDAGKLGLTKPKLEADIVTVSHDASGYNQTTGVEGAPKIFDWPGEYEAKDVVIEAIATFDAPRSAETATSNNVFTIILDEFRICHLGKLGHKLTSEQADEIGGVDILMVPVGGHSALDAKKAREVIEQLSPNLVIPMHYLQEGLKDDLDPLGNFLKEMGAESLESLEALKLKSEREIAEADAKIIVLQPKVKI